MPPTPKAAADAVARAERAEQQVAELQAKVNELEANAAAATKVADKRVADAIAAPSAGAKVELRYRGNPATHQAVKDDDPEKGPVVEHYDLYNGVDVDGSSITVRKGDTTTVSEQKAQQLLRDFPKSWERVEA